MNHFKKLSGVLSSLFLASFLCIPLTARADVRLPGLFSDNMVLQEGARVAVWGWADEGEKVTVTFRGQTVTATAKEGKWMVELKKLKAGGPDVLTITGKNSIELKNVLVGEVWVCGGQSNMEFALKNSFEPQPDIDAATNAQIRYFHVPKCRMDDPTNNVPSAWAECTPQNVPSWTAVGYYFARDLQAARKVPVGLIASYWGGTPAEAWMDHEALASNPRYQKEILDPDPAHEQKYQEALAAYEQKKADAKAAGTTFTNRPPGQPWKPSELYNGMIAPLVPYTIKGVTWYQGESNAVQAEQYHSLFPDLIRDWRAEWHEKDFPFLFVQLAPFQAIKEQPSESGWAELREAQLLTTKVLPKTGMAVITDVGNPTNIHPTKKQPVGARLALAARAIAYGEKIVYSGPMYKSMKVDGDKATLTFEDIGSGLEARDGALKGFAICGDDHKFVWATAEIDASGKHVVVSAPEVTHPVAVRYGWADCPVVNLWNKDGLPATPFRTDDFPMITAQKQ